MDLSKMSDDELLKLAQGETDSTPNYDFSKMSDDELRALAFKDLAEPKQQPPESFGKGLLRGTLKALPMAGSLIGGAIGGTAGLASPIPGGAALGAVGGSGLGAVAGTSLQQAGESLLFNEKPASREEQLKELGSQGLSGLTAEMGGQSIGPLLSAGKRLLGRGSSKATSSAEAIGKQAAEANAIADAKGSVQTTVGPSSAEVSGKLFEKTPPRNIEELRNVAIPEGVDTLQSATRLKEIQTIVPDLELKPLGYHYKQLENPKAMKEVKIQFENLPVEDAKKIASYNMGMLNESQTKLGETLKNITGEAPKNISDQGSKFIEQIKSLYKKEKFDLGPAFDRMQKTSPLTNAEVSDLKVALIQNSKLAPLMDITAEGQVNLLSNRPRTGLSQQEYGPLKEVMDDLSKPVSFKEIQNIRDFLRKSVDHSNPKATREIEKVGSVLLDQLESMASKKAPEMRETFKRYAINERAKLNIEKIIGGQLENIDSMYNANPDKIVNRILSNPNYVEIVKQYAGEGPIKEMTGAYINTALEKSFDKVRGFMPSQFRNFVSKNSQLIKNNLGPQEFDRISALADSGYLARRFLDEVNPSGTAASLEAMFKSGGFISKVQSGGLVNAITSSALTKVASKVKQQQSLKALAESLSDGPIQIKSGINAISPTRDALIKMGIKQQTDPTQDTALRRRMNNLNQQGGQ